MPAFRFPYDSDGVADVLDEAGDYADPEATLTSTRTWEWMHPLSETLTALIDAGLRLDFVHEHYEVPFRMFPILVPSRPGLFGWPDKKWLPLGVSIAATAASVVEPVET